MITKDIDYVIDHFRIKSKAYSKYTMSSCHFHDAYELYYLNTGSRKYYINNQTYDIEAGSLVMIPPYILHKTIDTGIPHGRLLLSFRPEFLAVDQHEKARLELLLTTLLIDIARYIEENESTIASKNMAKQRIYQVIDYLKTHYMKKISLEQLSKEFYISPYYLSRSFKKITGVTINKYIQHLRIIEGQRLLKETSEQISIISERLGYANVSAFDKQFKTYAGQSPKEYRQSSPKKSIL
jgi:AraC-like DNA-binding protein